MFDGTGAPPIQDAVVVIRDQRIFEVGPLDDISVPRGAQVVDLAGKWIIPGLIDAHTHLLDSGSLYTSPDDYDLRAYRPHDEVMKQIREKIFYTLSRYTCSGVTSVISFGGPSWEYEVREEAARSETAPDVAVAGPFISSFPVGEFTLWTEEDPVLVQARDPAHARSLVRELVTKKVDLVKTGFAAAPGVTLEDFVPILEALVDESHANGLRVAFHTEELEPAKAAVRAGCDILAHMILDQLVDEELIELMRENEVFVTSGLGTHSRYAQVLLDNVELLDIERICGDPDVIRTWAELETIPEDERPPMPEWIRIGSSEEAQRNLLENTRRLHEAGIVIAVGSNGGGIGTLQGPSYHRELLLMAEAGISPAEILIAATRNGALVWSDAPDRGTLEPGKRADLVILDADPLVDIGNASRIHAVVKRGHWIEQDSLHSSKQ